MTTATITTPNTALGVSPRQDRNLTARAQTISLRTQGHSASTIATHAQITTQTVNNIANRPGYPVRTRMATGIHRAHEKLDGTPPENSRRPAWPTVRRIRALITIGHTIQEISDGTGLPPTTIRSLADNDAKQTRSHIEDTVSTYYTRHEGDEARPIAPHYKNTRWAAPMEWNDIDNPSERHTPHPPRAKGVSGDGQKQTPLTQEHRDMTQDILNHWGAKGRASKEVGVGAADLHKIIHHQRDTISRSALRKILTHHEEIQMGLSPGPE